MDGLGHCSACHSPKNVFGADKGGNPFGGGNLDNWVAPDLTGNIRTGLGSWHAVEVAEFLKSCHVDDQGVVTADRVLTLALRGTDNHHFIVSGATSNVPLTTLPLFVNVSAWMLASAAAPAVTVSPELIVTLADFRNTSPVAPTTAALPVTSPRKRIA